MKCITLLVVLLLTLACSSARAATPTAVGWGSNFAGETGAGYKGQISATPVPFVGSSTVVQVAAGAEWSAALLADGSLLTVGGNNSGQLGDGTKVSRTAAVTIKLPQPITQIAIGEENAIALLADGTVDTWGSDLYGQLGNGTSAEGKELHEIGLARTYPAPVPGLSGVVAVYAGGPDDAVLLANGTVEDWGANGQGELADGTMVEKTVPTIAHVSNVRALAPGTHTLALLNDGTVLAAGDNKQGALGDGNSEDSPVFLPVRGITGASAISAGAGDSLAIVGGQVYGWGDDRLGQLGSSVTGRCHKVPCSTTPIPVPGMSGVSAIAAPGDFSLALKSGQVYGWGENKYNQLGDGSSAEQRTAPGLVSELSEVTSIAAGHVHALAVTTSTPRSPGVETTTGVGSITLHWEAQPSSASWSIQYRPRANANEKPAPYSPRIKLPASARSYTITGLQAETYEVDLQSSGSFGHRDLEATPR